MDRLSRNIGDVNNRFGEIIELVVLPGLLGEMNKQCGLKFDNVSPRKRFTDGGQEYAEIDLFLENGESVMAVEAKARFTLGMVNHFVRQVESLREHEDKAGVVGKTIYAAIAAIGIDENVRKFASEKGLYLVEVNNINSKVSISPPKEVVGKW
jgi:predicted RecB family endonuclease